MLYKSADCDKIEIPDDGIFPQFFLLGLNPS